ncbi:MAG TPA: tetratricopeptide repeat protein, partial [Planctomycetaceae bacterium]|nr:tetratricopeptide repeat protein [Planctomycetaceae bacterium]
LKRWIEAAEMARELLQGHPDHAEAHRWLGAIYYDLGAMNQAEDHLQKLSQLRPADYSPYRLLGLMHADFERYKEAITDYRAALTRKPPLSAAWEIRRELAKAQTKVNDFAGASQTLEELPDEGRDAESLALQAECLWSLGRPDEARQWLTRAHAAGPNDAAVLLRVARFARETNRTEEAIAPLQRILQDDPHNSTARYELALAYQQLGRSEDAATEMARRNESHALFEQMVTLNQRAVQEPTNADLRAELADVCEQLGKPELAAVWRDAANALRTEGDRPRTTPDRARSAMPVKTP